MSLRRLPYEIISYIVHNLDLADTFHLSRSCKFFAYLIQDNGFCRELLESVAPFALETEQARGTRKYASALRRLVKRRLALAEADPFLVGVVAVADSWLYVNGTLCHIAQDTLRVLDVHGSGRHEIVIDIPAMLKEAISSVKDNPKYRLEPIHFADGILSCLYTRAKPTTENWLIVLDVEQALVVTTLPLEACHKLFVRNNREYLYYGTHSEMGLDGYKRWVLKRCDIRSMRGVWFRDLIYLKDLVGSDIGSTICFEIFDDWLYGVSNETNFNLEEVDWTSCYYGFRFPLAHPGEENFEQTNKADMWRRQHSEGVIDNRWTSLRLARDPSSGTLLITEERKEWPARFGSSRRIYYTTELWFPSQSPSLPTALGTQKRDLPLNDPMAKLINWKKDRPNYMPAQRRRARMVHTGDDSSLLPMYALYETFARSYHYDSQTFMDLVGGPLPDYGEDQRVCIRARCRVLRPDEELAIRGWQGPKPDLPLQDLTVEDEVELFYKDKEMCIWPREQDKGGHAQRPERKQEQEEPAGQPNQCASRFNWLRDQILNPPKFTGHVEGSWDERSLVYATSKSPRSRKAIVLLSFDPAIRLKETESWWAPPSSSASSSLPGQNAGGQTRRTTPERASPASECPKKGMGQRGGSVEQHHQPRPSLTGSVQDVDEDQKQATRSAWSWVAAPMYMSIGRGFDFSR